MHIGLHVKYFLVLSDFNETWIFSTYFRKISQYQVARKSVQWEQSSSLWTDRRMWWTQQPFFAISRKLLEVKVMLTELSPLLYSTTFRGEYSVVDTFARLGDGQSGLRNPAQEEDFLFSKTSISALESRRSPIRSVSGLFPGSAVAGVWNLTT